MPSDLIRRVLEHYDEPFASARFVHFPSSGLSGAKLWRSDIGGDQYVLRRWPNGQMDKWRLMSINHTLCRVAEQGITFVPVPVPRLGADRFVEFDGTFWQLEPWMPGKADLADPPRLEKVAAAVEALAQFHAAASSGIATKCCYSPALGDRAQLLDELLSCGIELIQNAPTFLAPRKPWAGIAMTARSWLAALPRRATDIRAKLVAPLTTLRTLQPVIRDATRDHVLFTGDKVTGLVDFGALAHDHFTVDLARLAGSYGGDAAIIDYICQSYPSSKHVPRLTDSDRGLVKLLDRSGVLVAAYRWLRWIFVEERTFSDPPAVARRIGNLIARDVGT